MRDVLLRFENVLFALISKFYRDKKWQGLMVLLQIFTVFWRRTKNSTKLYDSYLHLSFRGQAFARTHTHTHVHVRSLYSHPVRFLKLDGKSQSGSVILLRDPTWSRKNFARKRRKSVRKKVEKCWTILFINIEISFIRDACKLIESIKCYLRPRAMH